MRSRFVPFAAFVGLAFAFATSVASQASQEAPRLQPVCSANSDDLAVANARVLAFGDYRGPIASRDSQAQRFFEQGLVFGWGFDFAEAVRSFRAAVLRDPGCALCRWGIAWALGPSINHDMREADAPFALDAIAQARATAPSGSRERDLIDALATRYSRRADAEATYADRMRIVASRFPADADVAVLAAEARMVAHAYDYWNASGAARAWTPEITALLDRALYLAPNHPGAHHYRIHLFEESPHPEQALESAEKLGALAPIVGHLVHMPSHIFFRLGRYRDAVLANQAAVQADRAYFAATGASSGYATHNLHFLWASALWSGDAELALSAADELAATAANLTNDNGRAGTRQHFLAAPLLTNVRLRRWDVTPSTPDASMQAQPYLAGLTAFANGISYAALGNVGAARAELESLRRFQRLAKRAGLTVKNINQAGDVLNVATLLLQSAIAAARRANSDAIRYARAAVRAEDRLATDDPPVWSVPARHALGAALLSSGSATLAAEAAAVYRADLRRYPHNAVSLNGLADAERRTRPPPISSALTSQSSVRRQALSLE